MHDLWVALAIGGCIVAVVAMCVIGFWPHGE